MSTYPVTSSLRIVKELQWVKETIEGTTPSNPIFLAIPTNEFVLSTRARRDKKFRKLGSADLTRVIEAPEDYNISIIHSPTAIDTFFYSMINLTGAQGNRENSFTFLISQQHNNAGTLGEMYQIIRGCKISSVKIRVKNGQLLDIQSKWLAMSASDWSTSHGLSGTPSFANVLTATPWSSTTTGGSPLTFGGDSYDVRNFTVTINHNTERIRVLDEIGKMKLVQQTRDIAIEMDVVYKNTVISQDVRTLTPRSMIMNIHVEPGEIYDLEFSNVYLESYDETIDANSKDAKVISYTGYATFVTLELVSSGNIVRALSTESVTIADSLSKLVHNANIIRAVPAQTVEISEFVDILVHLSHVNRVLQTETISISDAIAIEKFVFGQGNFATENFLDTNFALTLEEGNIVRIVPAQTITIGESLNRLAAKIRTRADTPAISISDSVARLKTSGGVNNIVRAVPAETITIAETRARLAAKLRPLAAQTTTLSDARARLTAKTRPLSTQTTSLSDSVARVKTPSTPVGPTRLFFHSTTDSTSGLPTTEQSTLTSIKNVDAQTVNRSMDITKGTSETSIVLTSNATASAQTYYFTRFVSPSLSMSSIAANTWTYSFGAKESSASANFPVLGSAGSPVWINCYVWRPSNQTKVGTILDGNTASTVTEAGTNTVRAHVVNFTGSAVSSMQNGDVLIIEIWFQVTQSAATAFTDTFYFDGTVENTVSVTPGTDNASYLETPEGLAFS